MAVEDPDEPNPSTKTRKRKREQPQRKLLVNDKVEVSNLIQCSHFFLLSLFIQKKVLLFIYYYFLSFDSSMAIIVFIFCVFVTPKNIKLFFFLSFH